MPIIYLGFNYYMLGIKFLLNEVLKILLQGFKLLIIGILIFIVYQIKIYDDAFTKGGETALKGANYKTNEDYELSGGLEKYNVKEIEVFEVKFE